MDCIPFVSMVTNADGNVVIIIRQMVDGGGTSEIAINTMNFSGLMYVLKAVEQQLIGDASRKRANELMAATAAFDFQNSYKPDMTRCDDIVTGDSTEIDFESSYDPCKPDMVQCDDEIIEKKKTIKDEARLKKRGKKAVIRDRLVEIYARFFCARYSSKIAERCSGCCFGNISPSTHDICNKLKKTDRVKLVFDDIMSEITDDMITQKLTESNEDGLITTYINKDTLMNDEKCKRQLIFKIVRYI